MQTFVRTTRIGFRRRLWGVFAGWCVCAGLAWGAPPVWHTVDQKTASGSGTALSVDRPDRVSEGDLILLIFTQQRSRSTVVTGFTVPDGFQLIRNEQDPANTERPEIVAFYKLAGDSEPAQYTSAVTNHGSVPQWKAIAARVTGHDPWEPIGLNGGVISGATGVSSMTIPQPPGVIYDSLLVAARTVRGAISGETTPTGMTLQWSANGTGSPDGNDNAPAVHVATETIATPGISGTRDFTWSGAARAAGLAFQINRYRPERHPRVNGLFFMSGDNHRYPAEPYAVSDNGSEMYVTYIDGMLHVILVVNRTMNDVVFSSIKAYTQSAGWNPPRPGGKLIDSEYAEFSLTIGTGTEEQTWSWYQGHAGGKGALGDNYTNQDWVSDTTVSGGLGTPPPGVISDGSMAANMRNFARRLRSDINPGWNMGTAGSSNTWTSPITNPLNPNNIINASEGYPASGWVTYSPTYQWEWAMVYEWAVDLTQFGEQPIFVVTGSSHHSPGKNGTEDDDFPPGDPDPLWDFGDLPSPYPTLLVDDGARHIIDPSGARLGSSLDSETDGQPHPKALGDDSNGADDEDGVELLTPLIPGSTAVVRVTVGVAGYLSTFIDWDGDGALDTVNLVSNTGPTTLPTGVIGDRAVQAGVYDLTITVPAEAQGGMPSRWRITNAAGQGGNSPTGEASSGEVEDYIFFAKIGDRIWLDENRNGIQDPGELGVDGITLHLYRPGYGPDMIPGTADDDDIVDTTVTSGGGMYIFDRIVGNIGPATPASGPMPLNDPPMEGLTPGRYYVHVVLPKGFLVSPMRQGGDPALDNDADPETGMMPVTTLSPGETDYTWDAGIYQKPTLAVISAVRARVDGGVVVIEWDVEAEIDTAGYYLERWTAAGWVRVNADLIWALPFLPAPKTYEQADPGAPLSGVVRYQIVELDSSGRLIAYGPFDLTIGGEISYEQWAAGIDWKGADSARDADPDRDGATNFQEYLAGTDPLSVNSVLAVTAIEPVAEGVRLAWTSVAGKTYAIEMTPSLKQPFLAVATGIGATAPENTHVLPVNFDAVKNAYFRVRVSSEP